MAKKNFKTNIAEQFISTAEEPAEPMQGSTETGPAIPKGYKLVRENKSERMQLLIRPTLKDAIKQEAQAQGLSMNDLIGEILEEYIERKGGA